MMTSMHCISYWWIRTLSRGVAQWMKLLALAGAGVLSIALARR